MEYVFACMHFISLYPAWLYNMGKYLKLILYKLIWFDSK